MDEMAVVKALFKRMEKDNRLKPVLSIHHNKGNPRFRLDWGPFAAAIEVDMDEPRWRGMTDEEVAEWCAPVLLDCIVGEAKTAHTTTILRNSHGGGLEKERAFTDEAMSGLERLLAALERIEGEMTRLLDLNPDPATVFCRRHQYKELRDQLRAAREGGK